MRQIESLSPRQTQTLVELFESLWWTTKRALEDVQVMLEHSLVVAFEDDSGELVAFARVISDRVYKALILDVVVVPALRGSGLGGRLLDAVLTDPRLARVEHFELYCAPDRVAFYERRGFTRELGTLVFMRAAAD